MLRDAPEGAGQFAAFRTYNFQYFRFRPDIKFAFYTFTVRVFRREKSAVRRSHVTGHISQNIPNRAFIERIFCDLKGFDQGPDKQRIVIKHFFEMRNKPFIISAVST